MFKYNIKIIGLVVIFLSLTCPAQETITGTQKAWYPKGAITKSGCLGRFGHKKSIYFKFKKSNNAKAQNQDLIYCQTSYFTAYIVNNSDQVLQLIAQDGSLQMIQEAQDSAGIWRPIEHWLFSWCGNSDIEFKLEPKSQLTVSIVKYQGDFKTKIRLKLPTPNHGNLYSNGFHGSIPYAQFEKIKVDTLSKGMFSTKPAYFE